MTDEQKVMPVVESAMDLFKAKQANFKPKEYTPEPDQAEMKHMRGKYAGEIMLAKRYSGEKDGNVYNFINISVRVTANGPKSKVNGVGRWLKVQPYSLVDKTNREGEVYRTAEEEIERFLNDLHTMGVQADLSTEAKLDATLDQLSSTKDMNDKYVAGTGRKVYMEVKPRYKFISDKKYELLFDDQGFPEQKFEFIPDIPGLVEGSEAAKTTGAM